MHERPALPLLRVFSMSLDRFHFWGRAIRRPGVVPCQSVTLPHPKLLRAGCGKESRVFCASLSPPGRKIHTQCGDGPSSPLDASEPSFTPPRLAGCERRGRMSLQLFPLHWRVARARAVASHARAHCDRLRAHYAHASARQRANGGNGVRMG